MASELSNTSNMLLSARCSERIHAPAVHNPSNNLAVVCLHSPLVLLFVSSCTSSK